MTTFFSYKTLLVSTLFLAPYIIDPSAHAITGPQDDADVPSPVPRKTENEISSGSFIGKVHALGFGVGPSKDLARILPEKLYPEALNHLGGFERTVFTGYAPVGHIIHQVCDLHAEFRTALFTEWVDLFENEGDIQVILPIANGIADISYWLGSLEGGGDVNDYARKVLKLTQPTALLSPINPYTFHKAMLRKRAEPVDVSQFTPVTEIISGYVVRINPLFFQREMPALHVTYKNLPKCPANTLRHMVGGLDIRVRRAAVQHEILNITGLSYEKLKGKALGDGHVQSVLDRKGKNDEIVPVVQVRLVALLNYVQSLPNTVQRGQVLSEREETFIRALAAIRSCKTGKNEGISAAYFYVVPNKRLDLRGRNPEDELVDQKYKLGICGVLSKEVEKMFSGSNPFARSLMGLKPADEVKEPAHQGKYLLNVVGPDVGLKGDASFDQLTRIFHLDQFRRVRDILPLQNPRMVSKSKAVVLRKFYSFFHPSLIVKAISDYAYCEDDGSIETLQKIGVLQVLKRPFLTQNPSLLPRFVREQHLCKGNGLDRFGNLTGGWVDQCNGWVQQIERLSRRGKESGYCWHVVPVNFNWQTFLAQNPLLGKRYAREQAEKGRTPANTPTFFGDRADWLQRIAKLSMQVREGGYCWVKGLPADFNWKTFLAQNPSLEECYAKEQLRNGIAPSNTPNFFGNRAAWVQKIALRSLQGEEAGYCWVNGLPSDFNWKTFLAQNPSLASRYLQEQRKKGRTPANTPSFFGERAAWFQAIALKSFQGEEAGYCWVKGLPADFNWKTFLAQNPSLASRYLQEQRKKGRIPANTPTFFGVRAAWFQAIALKSLRGEEGGYCWVKGLPTGFNWKQALTPSVKMRYMTEQLARTRKAHLSGKSIGNPAKYLTAADFAKDGTLKPRHKGWLEKQALWVQKIKQLGQI